MNNLEKCLGMIKEIDNPELLEQINQFLDNLLKYPLTEQTKIINKTIELLEKEGIKNV